MTLCLPCRVGVGADKRSPDGFLATTWKGKIPKQAGILIRFVEKFRETPFDKFDLQKALGSYPAAVNYGGPSTYGEVENIKTAFDRWAATYWKAYAFEVVPIAAELAGHTWPHHDWRWWTATERSPRKRYQLQRLDLTTWGWKVQA